MCKVISYRVRRYSDSQYIVEKHFVDFFQELEYQHLISGLRRFITNTDSQKKLIPSSENKTSTVHFSSSIADMEGFHQYIKDQCELHGYEFPLTYSTDHFNFFLATHYFQYKDAPPADLLKKLNSLTRACIQQHNAEVYAFALGREYDQFTSSPNFNEQAIREDDHKLIYTMNQFLRNIGYIDDTYFYEYRNNDAMIKQFWDDIGFMDRATDTAISSTGARILLYLSNASSAYKRVNLENNPRAIERAKHFLQEEIVEIECLNVGQANCSLGFSRSDKSNPLAIFDIGAVGKPYVQKKMRKATGTGIVVISHFDSDHITGWTNLDAATRDRIWILPQKRANPTETEHKLYNFLLNENCVILPNVDYSRESFDPKKHLLKLGNVSIYQGNCKKIDSDQSTDENARCLICKITGNRSMLLPGDCLYEEFPIPFSVDYMLVPHHSCCYTKDVTNIDNQRLSELIVCAGPNRGYHHPDISHTNRLGGGQCRIIFLMNNKSFYFENKNEIHYPGIQLTQKSHTVKLH